MCSISFCSISVFEEHSFNNQHVQWINMWYILCLCIKIHLASGTTKTACALPQISACNSNCKKGLPMCYTQGIFLYPLFLQTCISDFVKWSWKATKLHVMTCNSVLQEILWLPSHTLGAWLDRQSAGWNL